MNKRLMFLIRDDRGQDLIEYGLLAAIVATAGILLFPGMRQRIGQLLADWGTNVNALWTPNDPL